MGKEHITSYELLRIDKDGSMNGTLDNWNEVVGLSYLCSMKADISLIAKFQLGKMIDLIIYVNNHSE